MIFPDTSRIIYDRNPLDEVICQIRFPSILKIEKEIPVEFQDSIRDTFPEFLESEEYTVQFPTKPNEPIPPELVDFAKNSVIRKNFAFLSSDGKWKVNLSRDFISLSTVDYIRWESFQEKLILIIDTFEKLYSPSYYSRVGLRYKDVIRKSILGLNDVNWSELLRAPILGLLGVSEYEVHVEEQLMNTILDLDYHFSKVRIQNGLITLPNDKEKSFVIDSDFFTTTNMDFEDIPSILDNFHDCASRLIRWCITEKLHEAMEPKEL